MKTRQDLNPHMKVLKHTPSELVLLDGAKSYSYGAAPSAKNLIIQPLFAFIACSLSIFIISGSFVWQGFIVGTAIAAFPFVGLLLTRIYGGGRHSTYTFNKQSGILTCSTPAIFPYQSPKIVQYPLNQILDVEAITKDNDDPPPIVWRSIELRMRNTTIILYPGHDEQIQNQMIQLIRNFLR